MTPDIDALIAELNGEGTSLEREGRAAAALEALAAEIAALRKWLDNNTTFYNVDATGPVEGTNIPVLAQVSLRIWYHATDDITSYPFSAVIDAALAAKETK